MSAIKILPFAVLLMVTSCEAFAQEYRHLRVDVGSGLSFGGNFKQGGVIYYGVSWQIKSRFMAGPRVEVLVADLKSTTKVNGIGSFSLYSQYFISNRHKVRPFVGLGIGVYTTLSLQRLACDCSFTSSDNLPGFYPRVGIEAAHFTLSLDYNWVSRSTFYASTILVGPNGPYPAEVTHGNTNYFSMKFGAFLGGGKRKRRE